MTKEKNENTEPKILKFMLELDVTNARVRIRRLFGDDQSYFGWTKRILCRLGLEDGPVSMLLAINLAFLQNKRGIVLPGGPRGPNIDS